MNSLLNILKFLCAIFHEQRRDISAELEAEARQAVREHSARMAVK
jgi:hypothetical protein